MHACAYVCTRTYVRVWTRPNAFARTSSPPGFQTAREIYSDPVADDRRAQGHTERNSSGGTVRASGSSTPRGIASGVALSTAVVCKAAGPAGPPSTQVARRKLRDATPALTAAEEPPTTIEASLRTGLLSVCVEHCDEEPRPSDLGTGLPPPNASVRPLNGRARSNVRPTPGSGERPRRTASADGEAVA